MRFFNNQCSQEAQMKITDIRSKMKAKVAAAAAATTALALTAGNALAVEEVADLMASVDISGVKTSVYAFMLGLLAIGLLFFGRRLLVRMGVSQ
jgi:hypothetical protein